VKEEDENLKKKTKGLQLLIEKYKKELDKVRSECKHLDSELRVVKNKSEVYGSLRKVCIVCEGVVGYPSQNDIDTFYKTS
jgi:hypothetical protein